LFFLSSYINPVISRVIAESIAEELGLESGDKIIKINGTIVEDQLDFRFLQAEEKLIIEVEKNNGEQWILEVEKDIDEELGVEFEEATFDGVKTCRNKCLFCFVDQMPNKMRDTLYVKDDDYRHSFLFGNFITLTNLTSKELEKIVRQKISPLYVSIHTTNPDLRRQLLNNRHAGKILEQLKYLVNNGIYIHGQVVLVPGLNEGKELARTIEELSMLMPQLMSLAVVPVGLTKFRSNLPPLKSFTKNQAAEVIGLITSYQNKFLKQFGTRFVFPADEFYILAEYKIPDVEYYEGFPQLENGIGIVRLFLDEFDELFLKLPEKVSCNRTRLLLTATSGYKIIYPLVERIKNKYKNLNIKLLSVSNNFFGPSVTVTGLLTGQDIIKTINGLNMPKDTLVIIPDVMLKENYLFLDDETLDSVQQSTGLEIISVTTSGKGLIEAITGLVLD
jgi:putative radical SAM enzyme (TIGR03279 family)